MKVKRMLILGIGHNTAVYIELAELLGYDLLGLYHYKEGMTGQTFCGYPILGTNDELFAKAELSQYSFGLSMGDSSIRVNLAHKIRERNGNVPTMIHPSASVSRFASLADGVVVHSQATIQSNVTVKQDSVVSFNSGITHDAKIGEGVYVAGSSIVGAYTCIGRNAFIGMGAVIISSKVKTIGEFAVIGAGAVVTKDVEDYIIVAGNPAKVVGKRNAPNNCSKQNKDSQQDGALNGAIAP